MTIKEYTLADGKYKLVREGGWKLKSFRHGESWRDDDLVGDNLVHALLDRIDELEDEIENAYYDAREREERRDD